VRKLRLERQGAKDEFRFSLRGIVDGAGARALDQLLLQCLARDAREVHLDFDGVSEISALGLSVMQRHARAYEGTARRIVVHGIRGSLRESLLGSDSLLYAANGSSAEPEAAPETTAAPVPETAAAPEAAAPEPAAPEPAAGPSVAEHARLHAQLRRKIVEFRNLFEITQGLNLARDLDEVLNLFGLSVMGQFGVDRIALFLTDPDREGILLPRQVRGFAQDHFRDMKVPIAAAESLAASGPFVVLDHAAALAPSATSEPMVGGGMLPGAAEVAASLRKSGLEWGVALFVRRDLIGILFLGGRGGRNGFQENERDLLTILAHQAAVAIANARFHRQMEERNLGLVRGMMSLIESRDVYAQGSTERVVRFVTAMARVLQVPREQVKSLIYGSVLRDIGMIAVSHLILKNPAHLSEEEWALIRQHPTRGAQLLEEMNLPREVVDVVLNHHERWGGEGYPFGIKGPEIPLGARIVSLVDAYVAMTSERPYRRALPAEKARQVISENWGSPFDPSLVDVFLAVLEKMERRSRSRATAAPDAPADAGRETEPAALDPLGSGATIPVTMETDS
jgi:anti-anti-sigma regulatory factor